MALVQPTGVPHVHLLDAGLQGAPEYTGVYLLDTERPAIVETGFSYSVPRILEGFKALGVEPQAVRYIVPTHVHMDHAGGAGGLAKACPNAEVLVYEAAAQYLVDPSHLVQSVARAVGALFERYGEMVPIPEERLQTVQGGETLELGPEFSLEVVHAPGHAPHQFCLFVPQQRALFVADACGINRAATGRLLPTTPPPAFLLGESLETLNTLQALRPKTLLFTHYGAFEQPDLLGAYAELLAGWVSQVEQAWDTLKEADAVRRHFVRKLSPTLEGHYDPVMVKQEIEMNTTGVLLYLKRQRKR